MLHDTQVKFRLNISQSIALKLINLLANSFHFFFCFSFLTVLINLVFIHFLGDFLCFLVRSNNC